MTLANKPPKGAGQVQHVTQTDKLLKAIREAGTDQYGNPVGIRTNELEQKTGIPTKTITALLSPQVTKGMVVVCKVTAASGQTVNEYRTGPGAPPPEFKPLNTKRAGIATFNAAVRQVVAKSLVPVSRSIAPREPEVPVFLKSSSTTPQPAVGNTGSAQSEPTSADERAVASNPETPGPQPERRGIGPAPAKASAGDVAGKLKLAIDDEGVLQMGDSTDPARWVFTQKQTKQLGYFLRQTHDVWNPF